MPPIHSAASKAMQDEGGEKAKKALAGLAVDPKKDTPGKTCATEHMKEEYEYKDNLPTSRVVSPSLGNKRDCSDEKEPTRRVAQRKDDCYAEPFMKKIVFNELWSDDESILEESLEKLWLFMQSNNEGKWKLATTFIGLEDE